MEGRIKLCSPLSSRGRRDSSSSAASQLVTSGPYRFTRNPMYVGLTIAYIGGAAIINSAWPLILLPIVLVVLVRTVVSREEQYLSDAFGDQFTSYRSRVRRWL
ncbi:MAG TPA: isoprenylcysteine carboxylmethyltransferase family protein [Gemmatimonadaceae bacterium]|nr:isoprenylcysteine carboxylmethyltransferase family protein [Gemmatimonadaceae bacterium]